MALKVVFVLFLAMLLISENNANTIGDKGDCVARCIAIDCGMTDLFCQGKCIYKCMQSESVDTTDKLEVRNRVCNVGCSLGHCYKFLVQYDKEKFGSCMTSCSENYCIGNALEKLKNKF